MVNATEVVQAISYLGEAEGWLKVFFTDVNWSNFIATTLSAFFAAGAVTFFSNRSLNKRDKLQIEREDRKELRRKEEEKRLQQQKEINACNFYTNSVRHQMFDLFSLATQKEHFEEDLKHNPPLKPNSEYNLIILPEKIYSLISNISLKSMDNYFSAKFHMKKLNEGLDYILILGNDFERDIEIAEQNKGIHAGNRIERIAGIRKTQITRRYEEKIRSIFLDIKDENSQTTREGLYSIATHFYIDIFFSLACLQKDACNIGIELDVNKNGKKYFDPDFLKYFETEEAVQVITNSKAMGFSHAALIQAYIENPNDILNTAEKLANERTAQ